MQKVSNEFASVDVLRNSLNEKVIRVAFNLFFIVDFKVRTLSLVKWEECNDLVFKGTLGYNFAYFVSINQSFLQPSKKWLALFVLPEYFCIFRSTFRYIGGSSIYLLAPFCFSLRCVCL